MSTGRTTSLDVTQIDDSHDISVSVDTDTYTGTVTRVDTYGETTDVERVINYTITFKHNIDGPDWEEWKAYLVEEPAGEYRLNVVYSEGNYSRTENKDAPTDVVVSRSD
jgi:hypothetical protein